MFGDMVWPDGPSEAGGLPEMPSATMVVGINPLFSVNGLCESEQRFNQHFVIPEKTGN